MVAAYYIQITLQPFSDKSLNVAEQLSIFSSACVLYSGLFFVRSNSDKMLDSEDIIDSGSDSIESLLLVLDIISGVVFFMYCIFLTRKLLKTQLETIKRVLHKIFQSDERPAIVRSIYRRLSGGFSSSTSISNITRGPDTENDLRNKPSGTKNTFNFINFLKEHDILPTTISELLDRDPNGRASLRCRTNSISSIDDASKNFIIRAKKRSSSFKLNEKPIKLPTIKEVATPLFANINIELCLGPLTTTREYLIADINTLDSCRSTVEDLRIMGDKRIARSATDLGIVTEEEQMATFDKFTLRDDRFKDIHDVYLQEDDEIVKIEGIEAKTDDSDEEGQEVLNLSVALKLAEINNDSPKKEK